MTLLQLNYIMEIYNSGSMNKAAKNLYLAQSTISNAIKEVEDELGIRIFKRTNRGITVTEDGREFIAQIRPLLEQDKKIRKYYEGKKTGTAMRFSISSQRYPFCAKAFVTFLKNQQIDETYEAKYIECAIDQVLSDVSTRRSEIGVLYFSDMTQKYMQKIFKSNGLQFVELIKIWPCAFMAERHPLASKEAVSLEELRRFPCVVFDTPEENSLKFAEEVGLNDKYDFEKTIYINDRATAYNVIAHTEAFSTGSGILPKGYADARIHAVPISDNLDYMRLGYIKIEGTELSEEAEQYISILKKIMKEV